MDVCEVYRIPHSHFLGGALVWTQADRDKAIQHQLLKAETCSTCGTHPDQWDPTKGGDRHAFVAHVSRCAGCAAIEQQQEALAAAVKSGNAGRGERVGLKPREVNDGHHRAGDPNR